MGLFFLAGGRTRGAYHLTALPLPEQPDIVAVMQRVPNGVVARRRGATPDNASVPAAA